MVLGMISPILDKDNVGIELYLIVTLGIIVTIAFAYIGNRILK